MNLLRSIAMAFSMFSRFPAPRVEWKRENMRHMLACLPLVGFLLGAVSALWWFISARLGFGKLLFSAGMTALPVLLTGGIHMDGFMDTVDALSSHGDAEKKRAIMKDSHAGAFSVLYCGLYLLCSFALFAETEADVSLFLPVCLIPVMSRCLSAAASLTFPMYGGEGLLKTFREAGKGIEAAFPCLLFAAVLILIGVQSPVTTLACFACGAVCFFAVLRMSKKQFGGMSGDLAGFLLEVSEIALLLAIVICKKVIL